MNTIIEQGASVKSDLNDPSLRNSLIEQQRQFLALYETQAQLCAANMGEELKYMGTATVVKDIDFMTTVFDGEDAMMSVFSDSVLLPSFTNSHHLSRNFWGGSYGTILGAYLVNMSVESKTLSLVSLTLCTCKVPFKSRQSSNRWRREPRSLVESVTAPPFTGRFAEH